MDPSTLKQVLHWIDHVQKVEKIQDNAPECAEQVSRLKSELNSSQIQIQNLQDEIAAMKLMAQEFNSLEQRDAQNEQDAALARTLHEQESQGMDLFKTELKAKSQTELIDLVLTYKKNAESSLSSYTESRNQLKKMESELATAKQLAEDASLGAAKLFEQKEELQRELEETRLKNERWTFIDEPPNMPK